MRIFLLTIVLLLAGSSFAQDPMIALNIMTRDDDSGKKLSGATIVVKTGGSVFITKQSASNGKVPPIDLPLGQNYVVIIKKEGYVPKIANIDGHYDYPEDLPPFVPFPIETSLFKKVEGVDFSFLETTPMIKFELDQYGNQTWDRAYTKDMLKKIEELKKQIEEKKEEEAKKREDFEAFVDAGDKNMKKEEYKEAISNYEQALALFDEAEVKQKLEEAKKKLAELEKAAETEKAFQEKMKKAKDAFDAKSYQDALKLYKEASDIKPDEQLPKDRITEIEKILKDQKNQQAQFDKFVADGDNAMGSEDFDVAISNYESALEIKEDAGVKAKLEDAKKKKEEKAQAEEAAKELEEKYNNLITEADKLFDDKSYEDAKSKYKEALELKPKESHPAARISEIDDILKKLKEEEDAAKKLEEDYKNAIAAGDAAMDAKDWDKAITEYEKALQLKSEEDYPKDQIVIAKENKEKESAEAALNEKYEQLMTDAKGLKDAEKYQEAIGKYKEASDLKPDEQDPKDKIAEIEKLLEDLEAAKEIEEQYKTLMAAGEEFQGKDELEASLEKYEAALEVKPGDSEAQTKIEEVKKLISDRESAKEQEAKFKELVAQGDKDFGDKSYESAKSNYQKALDIKADADVQAKIAEIDEILAKQADQEALNKKYEETIKAADEAYSAENWEEALEKYDEALALKDEAHPKERIEMIKAKMAELEAQEAEEQKFNELVAEGDKLGGNMDYDQAILKYEEALKIKPDPEVSQKILDLKEKQKAEEANQELIAQYKLKIKEADAAFDAKNWDTAKDLYGDALDLKSDEQYPKDQLDEIERLMKEEAENEVEAEYQKIIDKANNLRDQENFEEAIDYYERALKIKSDDPYPKDEIKKIQEIIEQREQQESNKEALEEKYKNLITEGDKAFDSKDFEIALKKYQEAIKAKPNEDYPAGRIKEIEKILAEQEADAELEAKYKVAIDKADKLFDEGDWKAAKTAYQDALKIKDEQYPKDRMALCDEKMQEESVDEVEEQYQKILQAAKKKFDAEDYEAAIDYYERALNIKSDDPFPKEQIAKIKQIIEDEKAEAELEAKYKAAIDKADKLYADEDWKSAKTAYQDALTIKDEQYPKDQIELCNQKMQNESVDEEEEQYQKILQAAKKKFDAGDYEAAIDYYERALNIRPSDGFPKEQIAMIKKLIEEREAEAAKEAEYKAAIEKADKLFEQSQWKDAKKAYEDALYIKSTEQYPKDQIELCNQKMQNESVDEEEEQYQKILTVAQKKFDEKDYERALELYERAKGIRPSDPLPQQRIDEINQILKELEANKDKRAKYDKLIMQADTRFERKEWKAALKYYFDALDLYEEQYPKDQVALCRKYIKETGDNANKQYQKLIDKADEYFDKQNYEKAKGLYERAVRIKPSDQYPKDRLAEIDKILNPPPEINGVDVSLKDYGPPVNETPTDIEAMLHEAKEQANEFEIQKIYDVREDANETLSEWSVEGEDETFVTREAAQEVTQDLNDVKWSGELGRKEARDKVDVWTVEVGETQNEYVTDQTDDIMFQNRRVEAMNQDISEIQFENDKPREQYLLDVEKIKVERSEELESNTNDQVDQNMNDESEINVIVESHVTSDPNNDVARKNTEVEVEDLQVSHINANNEVTWAQEDEVMKTRQESEYMVDEINANNLDKDIPRTENIEIVEEINVSYSKREKRDANEQYDENIDAKEHTEEMKDEFAEMDYNNEEERQEIIVEVNEQQEEYSEVGKERSNDQYDVNIDAKEYTEEMKDEFAENDVESEDERQEVIVEVNEQQEEYSEVGKERSDDQYDENMVSKDYTEEMIDEIAENEMDNDKPRQEVVEVVEEKHIEYQKRETTNASGQTDVIMDNDVKIENIESDISDHNEEMESKRKGYEKEVEEIDKDITDYKSQLSENNEDNSYKTEDQKDDMLDDQRNNNEKMDEKAIEQAEKTDDAVQNHIDHVADDSEENEEELEKSEDYIETLKELDVNTITPELENELGEKYPEGVTEESYQLNDNNGLMKAYVVRRVVVKDGHGKVYEMTRTRYGQVTYTRNGEPISEYQWSDETSSASTTRN